MTQAKTLSLLCLALCISAPAAGDPEASLGGGVAPRVEAPTSPPGRAHRIAYSLEPRDVARFAIYPRVGDRDVDRANERPSRVDRRGVSAIDPLHRPLYILHPSLAVRVYRGEGRALAEVANLRRPPRALQFFAGN